MENRNFDCSKIVSPLSLRYPRVDDFTATPCFRSKGRKVLCVFRGVSALFMISWWLYNISAHMYNGKMFIYYSNICFTMASFYFVMGFNLSSIAIRQQIDEICQKDDADTPETVLPLGPTEFTDDPQSNSLKGQELTVSEVIFSEEESAVARDESSLPRDGVTCNIQTVEGSSKENNEKRCFSTVQETSNGHSETNACFKIYWIFFYISSNTNVVLAIGYLTGYLHNAHATYPNIITKQMIAPCLVAMDFLVSGIPVYMGHVLYPIMFTLAYYIFTLCYWAAGGTDPYGRTYIYKVLDYDDLSVNRAFIPAVTMLLIQPLIHLGFYIISTTLRVLQTKTC